MTIEKINIEPNNFNILKVQYTKSDLVDILNKAFQIEGNLNPYDPAGNLRDENTISIKNLAGLISEKLVSDLLTSLSKYKDSSIEIIDSNWEELENSLYQIDHQIKKGDKIFSIETRSSFSYRTKCPENVINYAFSIIGPYTTNNKSKEHYKDLYAFIFYCINPDSLKERIENNDLTIYFAGGATIDMLEKSENNLKQRGATYLTLKPITRGLDAQNFLKTILKI